MANILRTLGLGMLIDRLNVILGATLADLEPHGDGVTDDSAKVAALGALRFTNPSGEVVIGAGIYRLSSSVTLGRARFLPGAVLKFDSGVTATFTQAPTLPAFGQAFDVTAGGGSGPVFQRPPLEWHLEWFGVVGDGVTDDTTLMIRACQCFSSKRGTTLKMRAGATYRAYPTGSYTPYGTGVLLDFTGAVDQSIEGNGATISVGDATAANNQLLAVYLNGVSGFDIRGLRATQDNPTLLGSGGFLSSDVGLWFITSTGDSDSISVDRVKQVGGRFGLQCRGEWPDFQYRTRGIRMTNAEFTDVYYPQAFENSGDDYFARNIRTINCGRSYFPTSVRNHDVRMYSEHGGPFDDVVIIAKGYTGRYSTCENIKLVYHTKGRYASGQDQGAGQTLIACDVTQWPDVNAVSVAGPATLADIDITVIAENTTVAPVSQRIFMFRKRDKADAPDLTGRGHNIVNVRLGGRVVAGTALVSTAFDLFANPAYGWTGDFAQNVRVESLEVLSDPGEVVIAADGAPFINGFSGLTMDDVSTEGQIALTNFTFNRTKTLRNVRSANFNVTEAAQAFTPTWGSASSAPSLGDGTLTGKLYRSGQRVRCLIELTVGSTTTFGTGAWHFDLPTAVSQYTADTPLPTTGIAFDTSASTHTPVAVDMTVTSPPRAEVYVAAGGVGGAVPFTWAAGDKLRLTLEWVTNN